MIKWLKEPWPARKGIKTTNYEIKLWHEVVNDVLHVVLGGVIIYAWIPHVGLISGTMLLIFLGFLREYIQWWRGKQQPKYITIIDVLTVGAGMLAYSKTGLKKKVDKL